MGVRCFFFCLNFATFSESATFLLLFSKVLRKKILCNLIFARRFKSGQQLSGLFFMEISDALKISVFACF